MQNKKRPRDNQHKAASLLKDRAYLKTVQFHSLAQAGFARTDLMESECNQVNTVPANVVLTHATEFDRLDLLQNDKTWLPSGACDSQALCGSILILWINSST